MIKIFQFFLLVLPISILAQNKITITGYVQDYKSGEKIVNASILSLNQKLGTTTNNYGYFTITLPGDSALLYFSSASYSPVEKLFVNGQADSIFIINLIASKQLDEVVVSSRKKALIQERTQMSQISIPIEQIKAMPKFLGETDILKSIQLLPGVQQGAEGTSGIIVRGGGPDQNLILLDGTQVYNPQHLFGIFSSFNADAVKNVELYKGGFPARFGGRLSSVIDVVTRDGSMTEFKGEGGIGLLASRLTLEGPIKKNKTSILVSGRRSYLDVIAAPLIKASLEDDDDAKFGAYFYDLNLKINHIFSPKDRLFFSFFSGQDFLKLSTKLNYGSETESTKVRLGFGNLIGTTRWNHIFNKKLFANILVNFTEYRFINNIAFTTKTATENTTFAAKYFSGIKDFGARIDFDYRPSPKHTAKFGAAVMQHIFTPGATSLKSTYANVTEIDTSFNSNNKKSLEANIYAEDDWQVSDKLKMNIGLHISAFKADTKIYPSVQPRIGIRYLLPRDWALKTSYTHMNQFIHLLGNNNTTLPTDLWVPSTDNVKPMLSKQIAIGFAKSIWKDRYEFSIEAYNKSMDGVIEYKDGANFLNTSIAEWDTKVEQGKGRSRGIEILLQKKLGKTTGWVGYTLSKTDRIFNDINFGKRFNYKYDRTHDFEITVTHKLSKRWDISGNWAYSTGNPFTLPLANYTSGNTNSPYIYSYNSNQNLEYYKGRNEFRLLDYHRMDIGFTYTRVKKKHTKIINISFYNAYNRQNPFYYQLDYIDTQNKAQLNAYTLLPIIPSFTYSFKF